MSLKLKYIGETVCPKCGNDNLFIPDYKEKSGGEIGIRCNVCGEWFRGLGDIKEKKKELAGKWYLCPHCGKALFPLKEDTRIEHMPFRCKACKHDIEVSV